MDNIFLFSSIEIPIISLPRPLQITVLACNGLPKFAGAQTPLNPYIKLRLLPEGQHRVKTRMYFFF